MRLCRSITVPTVAKPLFSFIFYLSYILSKLIFTLPIQKKPSQIRKLKYTHTYLQLHLLSISTLLKAESIREKATRYAVIFMLLCRYPYPCTHTILVFFY